MNTCFDKIQQNNCTLYINKNFHNANLKQTLLAGEKELQGHHQLTAVRSSDFTQVYKFTVMLDSVDKGLYLKRYLSRSVWDFVKHVVRASRAKRAFKATMMLQENGFDSPTVIAMSERESGLFHTENFLVTLEVENAKPIYQIIPESLEEPTKEQWRRKRELIMAFGHTIGRMHAASIFHGDLRPGNVLARQDNSSWQFFFIDNERTKKFYRLPARLRLKNLVQVNMLRSPCFSNCDRMRFFKAYLHENPKIRDNWKYWAKKTVAKTNRRLQIRAGKYTAVFDKDFHQRAGAVDFVEKVDAMMDGGKILKKGGTSYVSRISWGGKDVVVKRYNHKGFIHSLRHTIKRSRARRGWLYGHRLGMLNIATPKPLAYIEYRKGLLVWQSYLVTEYVEGQKLYDFLRDSKAGKEQRSEVTGEIVKLLNKLGEHRISHGDLKHTNILITDNGPVLTDLDGMRVHKLGWAYKVRRAKDIARFLRKTNRFLCKKD